MHGSYRVLAFDEKHELGGASSRMPNRTLRAKLRKSLDLPFRLLASLLGGLLTAAVSTTFDALTSEYRST